MNRIVRKISNTLSGSSSPRKESSTAGKPDFLIDPLIHAQKVHIGLGEHGPVQRLCSIIEDEEEETAEGACHPLFCEMLKLFDISSENRFSAMCWREVSRWIKYEETVEMESNRWSKPHITLLTLQCLLQLRNSIRSAGDLMLDVTIDNFNALADRIVETWGKAVSLSRSEMKACKEIILAPKYQLVGSKYGSGKEGSMHVNESFYNITEPGTEESTQGYKPEAKFYSIRAPQINLLRKIPKEAEGACILFGRPDDISCPLTQFVRLKKPTLIQNLFEVPIQLRFLFILLVPKDHVEKEAEAIARCMGTLFIDEVRKLVPASQRDDGQVQIFSKLCYKASDSIEICEGIDEFLSQCVVVPAGRLSLNCRLEPHEGLLPPAPRHIGKLMDLVLPSIQEEEPSLQRTGRLFGGFIEDVKIKSGWFLSDFTDAFRGRITQTIAAAIFLFFANVSKIITFGGVMDHVLGKQMNDMDFLLIRLWVGLWTSFWLIVLVAIDASAFVAFITRFTEEAFATLISLIFLVKAFEELVEIGHKSPVAIPVEELYTSQCRCSFNGTNSTASNWILQPSKNSNLTQEYCLQSGGSVEGLQCTYKPDVFMFSFVLFFGTFVIAKALKLFRDSRFFTTKIRHVVADFNVTIAILVMTVTKSLVGVDVPCLEVPEKFAPSIERSWILNPLAINYWWMGIACALPASFFSILILMDQNITSVIINRPENKLKKHYGYHLDLAVIAVLIAICSFLGIPFYVAATVISLMHVDSLRIMSETTAPGDHPQFLGLKEQRVTGLIAHLLIGVSVMLTPFMRLIPMPVLLGVFLYMGIVSLAEQQFFQRILIIFMPKKYQPDYFWLRQVKLNRVHLFTTVQIVCFCLIAVVEEYKAISMAFPVMLVFMVMLRKVLLEKIFTSRELQVLDDPLPPWKELFRVKPKPGAVENQAAIKAEHEMKLLQNN